MQESKVENNGRLKNPWRNLSQFSGFNDTSDPDGMETDEVCDRMPNSQPVAMDEELLEDVGVLVVDTNFFIDYREFFCELMELGSAFNLLIIVPFVVLQELDGLKHSKGLGVKEKRELSLSTQQLHRYIAQGHRGIRGQRREQILREESVQDDQILDCCLYFQSQFPYTLITLLTRDRLLTTKALVHNIYHVDVKDLTPRNFLTHLASKASGQDKDKDFIAPESFKSPQTSKPGVTPVPNKSKANKLGNDTARSIHSRPGSYNYLPRKPKDKPKASGLEASMYKDIQWKPLRPRSEKQLTYNAGSMTIPPENPNKPLSAKQSGLHALITELMNYAENELSLLLIKYFQQEFPQNPEPWLESAKTNPPWTLHQITSIVQATPKLTSLFTPQVLSSFDNLLPLIKTYHRLHEYGFEMFLPDINALMKHILNLFVMFETFDSPDVLNSRYSIVSHWLDVHKHYEALI